MNEGKSSLLLIASKVSICFKSVSANESNSNNLVNFSPVGNGVLLPFVILNISPNLTILFSCEIVTSPFPRSCSIMQPKNCFAVPDVTPNGNHLSAAGNKNSSKKLSVLALRMSSTWVPSMHTPCSPVYVNTHGSSSDCLKSNEIRNDFNSLNQALDEFLSP